MPRAGMRGPYRATRWRETAGCESRWDHESYKRALCANDDLVSRLELQEELDGHYGCVNTVSFDPTGSTLISGSDDQHLILWDWAGAKIRHRFATGHRNNIFQGRALPCSPGTLVSCGADGQVRVHHLGEAGGVRSTRVGQHYGRAHKIALSLTQPHCFLSTGEDGVIRHFDCRESSYGNRPLALVSSHIIEGSRRARGRGRDTGPPVSLNSVAYNPARPWQFCVGGDDECVRVLDERALGGSGAGPSGRDALQPGGDVDSDGEALDASEMPYLSLHPTAGARPADPRTVQHLSPWHLSRRPPPGIPAASLRRGTHVTCAVYSDVGEIAATYNDDDVYLFAPEGATEREVAGHYRMCEGPDGEYPPGHAPRDAAGARQNQGDGGDDNADSDRDGGSPGNPDNNVDAIGAAGWDRVVQRYWGHRNLRTVKGVSFFGSGDGYVVSGSDCGHFYIWDKLTGRPLARHAADEDVVNCLEPHPHMPGVLATSGIDYTVKIWAPTAEEPIELTDSDRRIMTHQARSRNRPEASPFVLVLRDIQMLLAATPPSHSGGGGGGGAAQLQQLRARLGVVTGEGSGDSGAENPGGWVTGSEGQSGSESEGESEGDSGNGSEGGSEGEGGSGEDEDPWGYGPGWGDAGSESCGGEGGSGGGGGGGGGPVVRVGGEAGTKEGAEAGEGADRSGAGLGTGAEGVAVSEGSRRRRRAGGLRSGSGEGLQEDAGKRKRR